MLVLDSLEDPQNFGTLLRSGEAVGVHGVVYPTRRAAPLSPSAIKASAGATEHLLLAAVEDLPGTLADLHGRGLRIVAAEEDAALDYADADLRGPIAMIVGSEGKGISAAVRRRIDLSVRIPMRGKIASLNAAVAGSVLLFTAARQRPFAAASALAEAEPEKKSTTKTSKSKSAAAQAEDRARKRKLRRKRKLSRKRRLRRNRRPTQKLSQSRSGSVGRRKPHRRESVNQRKLSKRRRQTRAPAERRLGCEMSSRFRRGNISCILSRRAAVAQLVEQRFCKPPVAGSSPIGGSTRKQLNSDRVCPSPRH